METTFAPELEGVTVTRTRLTEIDGEDGVYR